MFKNLNLNFVKFNKMALIFSSILLILSFFIIFVKGLNLGIDFTGGIIFDLNVKDKILENKIKNKLSFTYKNNLFQSYDKGIIIKIPKKDIKNENKDIENITKIIETVDNKIVFNKIDFIGPQVGEVLIKNGIISLLLSLFGILFYIWVRFKLKFGISAVVCLLHDIIILFGFISIFNIDFDLTIISSILIIIGYSINDTVVIFDRIRENTNLYKEKNIEEIVNISINNNLRRTLYTSVSTLLAILPLVFSNIDSLENFGIVIIFGIIIGTYSSIFIATSMLIKKHKLKGVNK